MADEREEEGPGNFLIIGLTNPGRHDSAGEEAAEITAYLESGAVDIMHIRKPEAEESYVKELAENIPAQFRKRLVAHSHYRILMEAGAGGIHDKEGAGNIFKGARFMTKSCHTIEECLREPGKYRYRFLSPVFDSISKKGYKSAFTPDSVELRKTLMETPVVGLGGVTPERFGKLFDAKFAGAALLGYLWSLKTTQEEKIESLLAERRKLK